MTQNELRVGLLGFGNANSAIAYWLSERKIPFKVWATPDHPGALKQSRRNGGKFRAHGNAVSGDGIFDVNEASDLLEIIEFSSLLILAVNSGEALDEYVKALSPHNSTVTDKALFVVAGTAFQLRYMHDLHFRYVIESTASPTASGLEENVSSVNFKEKKTLMEVACIRRWEIQGAHLLPYECLYSLPTNIFDMITRCFGIDLKVWPPAALPLDSVKTSLHGVPTSHHLEVIADDHRLAKSDRPDRGYFYGDWSLKHVKDVEALNEETLILAAKLGHARGQKLVEDLCQAYGSWTFESLSDLYGAKHTCYNIQKLTPHSLDHRFVVEAYIGFKVQAALGRKFGVDMPLTAGHLQRFDDLARRRGLRAFEPFRGDLQNWTVPELQEFGYVSVGEAMLPSRMPNGRLALGLPPPPNRQITDFNGMLEVDRSAKIGFIFSGGLDGKYLVLWAQEQGFRELHLFTVDLGQAIDRDDLYDFAQEMGADLEFLDGQDTFSEHVATAIKAHAMPYDLYPVSSTISRPVIVEVIYPRAREIGVEVLLHTANLSQNSLPRLNTAIQSTGFSGRFGSPYENSIISRDDKARKLVERGFVAMANRSLSGDENAVCREFESGPIDNPEDFIVPEDAWHSTREANPLEPAVKVSIRFERGVPVLLNGIQYSLLHLIARLDCLLGPYCYGRSAGLEHIFTGEKVLEVREAPGLTFIMQARRHLEVATLSRDALSLKRINEMRWIDEGVRGSWASQAFQIATAAIVQGCSNVSGTLIFKVDAHMPFLLSIKADNALYIKDRNAWEKMALEEIKRL